MSIQISRSAFRRVGDTIDMKPGVEVLKVGSVNVTGITLDTNYALDVTSHLPVFKDNREGVNTTKTFAFTEDLFTGAVFKTSLLPSLAKILVSSSANQAVRDLTTVEQGDIDIQQDNEIAYIYDHNSVWQSLAVTPTTYTVDVADSKYRLNGKGLAPNLTWSGSNMPELRLFQGTTYTFDQSTNNNSSKPLFITTESNGGDTDGDYTTGVIYRVAGVVRTRAQYDSDFDSYDNSKIYQVEFTVPHNAPDVLYLQSPDTANMGAKLVIETSQDLTSISGDVIPSADGTQDLGSLTKQWNQLYLGGTNSSVIFDQSSAQGDRTLPSIYDYTKLFLWLKGLDPAGVGFTEQPNFTGASGDVFYNLMSKKQIEATYETDSNNEAKFLSSTGLASLSLEESIGGVLNLGDDDTTIGSGSILGRINFTSDATILSGNHTHAYIVATTNDDIDASTNIGDTDLAFYTGKTSLTKSFELLSDNSSIFYGSPVIKQMAKTTFNETTEAGTGTIYKTKPNGTNLFPLQFANLVANTTDDNLYYIHRKNNAQIDSGSGNVTYEIYEETDLTGFIRGVQDLTDTSPDYAINVSQLKINGVVIDLDNISSNYDFWSNVQATTTITTTSGTKTVTPTITLPSLGSIDLLPADATLTNATLLIKWRLTSNTATAVNNINTSAMKIETNITGAFLPCYTFADDSYHVPSEASASGDVLAINLNLNSTQIEALQADLDSDVTVTLQIIDAESEVDSLIFRDLSWGLRLFWR